MTKFDDNWTTSTIRPVLMQGLMWNIPSDTINPKIMHSINNCMLLNENGRRHEMSWNLRLSLIEEISENI